MIREMKFRGWDENTKKWLYSLGFLKHGNSKIIMILKDTEDGFVTTPVNPDTVGQYTGLKDKNGKDIYEGDVYECIGTNYVVTFNNGAFCGGVINKPSAPLGWDLETGSDGYTGNLEEETNFNFINVIGNIHDNPELIK
jgi:uncharacterized phage protein (TIGR01671 family)